MRSSRSLVAILLFAPALAVGQPKVADPRVDVRLLANVTAVQPGTPFDLALAFDLEDEYHIYWKTSGDSGQPPQVTWRLPEGFTVSELRYPIPHRDVAPGGIVTNVLDGAPVLLATVTPPATLAPDAPVRLGADLTVLVCKTQCFRRQRTVALELPVGVSATANDDTFSAARHALPVAIADAKYLSGRALIDRTAIRPRDSFRLAVVVDIAPRMHVQSHTPSNEFLTATDVYLEDTEGLFFDVGTYPAGKIRRAGGQQFSEYEGRVVILFEGQADNELPDGPLVVSGLLRYQACTESGQCYPPAAAEWTVQIPIASAGSPTEAAHAEVFGTAKAATEPARPAQGLTVEEPPAALPVDTPPGQTASADSADDAAAASSDGPALATTDLLWNMLLAALGGMILNVMPCVLPVISIKILSFVQQSGEDPRRVLVLGLSFASGILTSFLALGTVFVVFKTLLARNVGWGFHFANPVIVITMAAVVFLFGLSLFGVFEIYLPGSASTRLGQAEAREGVLGAFLKGVLGTVLATPCTAPMMGSAIAFALAQSPVVIMLIMGAMGLGMAAPFILLSAQPAWMKFLPRPGAWMERFKQFMGFLLMGTVVWLLHILGALVGTAGVAWVLAFFLMLALAAWLIGMIELTMSPGQHLRRWLAATSVTALSMVLIFGHFFDVDTAMAEVRAGQSAVCPDSELIEPDWESERMPWQRWSADLPRKLAARGYTVFVDYTATWCATCQTNKPFFTSAEVRRVMKELRVVPIKADYTHSNSLPEMTAELQHYGSAGVPLNIIVPADQPDSPIILPVVLVGRSDLVITKLREAGASTAAWAVATP